MCTQVCTGYHPRVKHRGTKRSHQDRAALERAQADARASRVAQGLPERPEDALPETPARKYVRLPSGDWWPEGEPLPADVATLKPQVSVWTRPGAQPKRRG